MIDANTARRISTKDSDIAKASAAIEKAANSGKRYITLDEWEIDVNDRIKILLEELGYNVSYFPGGDFDRAASFTISW